MQFWKYISVKYYMSWLCKTLNYKQLGFLHCAFRVLFWAKNHIDIITNSKTFAADFR